MPTFVSPLLLAGGLLIGIPILLHLVMRERPKHLVFPALRFVRQRREANRRRLRLRHLLLLLLRCAAIALFALAVARPVFRSSGFLSGGRAPVAAALVFDTRPRMQYRHHNQTRLEAAQNLGTALLQELPRDSDLVVLDSSATRTRFDIDRGAAAQRIGQLKPTYSGQTLIDSLDSALSVLRGSDKQRKEVFVLTDMSTTDWQTPQQVQRWRQRLEENPEVGFYVLDVGVTDMENFALGDLALTRDVVSENALLGIESHVTGVGSGGDRLVQLFLEDEDGRLEKKGEQMVSCRPGESQRVEFRMAVGELGTQQGHIRFARSDNLTVDDVRYFTVRVKTPWHILVAASDPAERNARLLCGALAPPTLRRRGEAQYEFDIVSHDVLERHRLSPYDAVWLLDPPPLNAAVWNRLSGYVSAGGGLAIALGGRAGFAADLFNATASLELLPGELKRQWKNYDLYLAPDRLDHPVLYKFKGREGQIPWALNPVFKIWELGPLMEGTQVVVYFSDRQPALLARNVGAGRVLTMTTPLGSSSRSPWNHLLAPKEEAWPGFVLVNGMTEYLVGSVGQRLNFHVGEAAPLKLEKTRLQYESYLLTTPVGTQRVKPDTQGRELLVSGTDAPGQYRVEAGGRQGVRYGFSANVPEDTTQLGHADPDEVSTLLEDAELPIAASMQQLRASRQVAAGRSTWEAYPWLIVLLVIVAASEGLLATFFYRRPAEQAADSAQVLIRSSRKAAATQLP